MTDAGLKRQLTCLEAVDGVRVRVDGREVVNWCSNDYLGLSQHSRLAATAAHAATSWGVGARASRLLAGTTRWHADLERALAAWFGAERAIVYSSGYVTNLGVLGALLTSDDAVFMDRLVHASLVDAVRASRATLKVFHHNDPAHLVQLLSRTRTCRRRLIVTEGVFSMNGDVARLQELVEAAEAHDALLYLDDAHGAFVLGARGRGTPEACGISHERFIYMGTLGKALGCQGGFVIGPATLIEWLHNHSRPFIYSTALAVPIAAAAVEALRVLQDEPGHRAQLHDRVGRLHRQVAGLIEGSVVGTPTHIIPVVVGDAKLALELSGRLMAQGHWALAIRPPTVPKGTARLRVGVTALHTDAQIDAFARALRSALAEQQLR